MVHPEVEDGGDSLHVWRVAANILNKQSRTAKKGMSSRLGLTTPYHKKKSSLPKVTKCLGPEQILWINDMKLRKMDMRFGTWNVRIHYRAGLLMTVMKELQGGAEKRENLKLMLAAL
jgi:hypothetical protein